MNGFQMNKIVISLFVFVLIFVFNVSAQTDALKNEALKEMQSGRYGEAIDMLNRYISAKPQESSGYNLRGLCYEKRSQFEAAVYDFRSARKIQPDSKEININLSRATDSWYKLIYNRIEGYKREIALNPKKAGNYLEMGKSYKSLGEWIVAEEWYDKYLSMEEGSADEIIRYTEILAKNTHIAKGEPILKKYVEKYPSDHRLWSRYGFFSLWLGKNKVAIDAFEKALALRPYFKEAMDGLDQAKGKGYIYTINDTSYNKNKASGNQRVQEYAIDKYFKIIKNKPDDNNTRYQLVDELLKNLRVEEAYEQLLYMQNKEEGKSEKFKTKWDLVAQVRDSVYQRDVRNFADRFKKNNNDKEAALKLSNAYAHLFDYDNAISTLEGYLSNVKEDQDLDVRYILSKYCAWSYQWDKAFKQANILLDAKPDNKDYQLLMAQLISWNVIDAKPEEITKAKSYLNNIFKDDPKNMPAILAMVFLDAGTSNFDEALKYIQLAKSIDPASKEVEAVDNYYNTRLALEDEKKVLKLREVAGKQYDSGDCKGAAETFEQIMSMLNNNPERTILLEYASINSCAKNYNSAITAYDKVLLEGFDMEIASLKAMNVMWAGDTAEAINQFLALKEKDPNSYAVNFYLGDLYERIKQPEEAVKIYENLLVASEKGGNFLDSTQVAALNTRLGYLSSTGGSSFGSIFGYLGLTPLSSVYSDNQNFTFHNYGLRADVNLAAGFGLGATYLRNNLDANGLTRNLTSFKGHLTYRNGYLGASIGMGKTRTLLNVQTNLFEASARYEIKDRLALGISYEKNDARVIIFSPNIINELLNAEVFRLSGYFYFPNNFIVSSYFHYLTVSDNNAGNDFQLRIGKTVLAGLNIGYEFYYSNYSYQTVRYYSPKNFESHSIWADYKAYKDEEIALNLGGRLGYVPANDFIIREAYGEAIYHPFPILTLSGRVTLGSSYRYDTSYSYVSAIFTGYLSIF